MTTVNTELAYNPGTEPSAEVALGPDDISVTHFKTPAVVADGGWFSAYEHKALPWNRAMCISTTPGDFTKNSITYKNSRGFDRTVCTNYKEDFEPTITFFKNPASGGFALLPNTDYYVSVKTLAASQQDCDIQVTLFAAKVG